MRSITAVTIGAGLTVPLLLSGCLFFAISPGDAEIDGGKSGTTKDAGPQDAGQQDAGPQDAGQQDAGPQDAGPQDAGPQDAGPQDAGPQDAGPQDAGPQDAGPQDAGNVCGNGDIEFPEVCDDENGVDDDYCSNDCRRAGSCGDGVVQTAVEACDPAATGATACTERCTLWWNDEYPTRVMVDVENTTTETLLNVPFAVSLPPDLQQQIKPVSGQLCGVALDHETIYPVDIEPSPEGTDAVVWVQVPILPPGTFSFYLYGTDGDANTLCLNGLSQLFAPTYAGVWHMESTSPVDATGNGRNATPFGTPSLAEEGMLGRAVRTGFDSHVRVDGAGAALGFLEDMTVEGWVVVDAFANVAFADRSTIFQVSPHLTQIPEPFLMNLMHNGNLRASWRPDDAELIETSEPTDLVLGEWQHLAWVRDATDLEVRFYVNGVQHGAPASYTANPTTIADDGRFRMGGSHFDGWSLLGAIDEVRLSGQVLSPGWLQFEVDNVVGNIVTLSAPETLTAD